MNPTNKKPLGARGVPAIAQLKTAGSAQSVKRPVAPPVYRPQQGPRVLQTKSSSTPSQTMGQTQRGPVAPPVYRPEAKKIVQPKAISQIRKTERTEQVRKGGLPPLSKTPTAPPVYRPEQKRVAQSPIAHAPKARTVHSVQAKGITPQAGRSMLMKPQQINPSVLQRKFAPQLRGHASRVVQCEPTDEEKALFTARVGQIPHRFETVEGSELALVPTNHYYMLIRPQNGRAYWRKYKLKHSGGRGFYGRLVEAPPSLDAIAAARNEMEVWSHAVARQIEFSVASAMRSRENNNRVMGLYLLDGASPMPASVYALRRDCEWLHMQGHGLGGLEEATNLYAGSHGANSQMAAVETALQSMRDIYGGDLTVNIQVITDEDYHSEEVCRQIAALLSLDGAAVYRAMSGKESRMLEYIEYTVAVRGARVWTEKILPFQERRFDEAQFKQINERVREAIQGLRSSVAFVSGGLL